MNHNVSTASVSLHQANIILYPYDSFHLVVLFYFWCHICYHHFDFYFFEELNASIQLSGHSSFFILWKFQLYVCVL